MDIRNAALVTGLKRHGRLLLLALGMFMIAGGFSFSSEFVGRHFTEDGSIGPSSRGLLLWIQSMSVSLGTLSVLAALILSDLKNKTLKSLMIALLLFPVLCFFVQGYMKSRQLEYLPLKDFSPKPIGFFSTHSLLKAKFPVVDVHSHVVPKLAPAEEIIKTMDEAGISTLVDLDGLWENELKLHLKSYREKYPDRFLVFVRFDYDQLGDPETVRKLPEYLHTAVTMGAKGLKVTKNLGIWAKDQSGNRFRINNPALDPLWRKAGELGIPVLVHQGDPAAFFQELNSSNERLEELLAHPNWHVYGDGQPTFQQLLDEFESVIAKHPHTIFIGAHAGNCAENLDYVATLLDKYPNYYIEPSARIAELGRKPYSSRAFFIKYQDRILFGADAYAKPSIEVYRLCWRFFETNDEYFDYSPGISNQGRWKIYGIALPDHVLQKLYHYNASKLLGLEGNKNLISKK